METTRRGFFGLAAGAVAAAAAAGVATKSQPSAQWQHVEYTVGFTLTRTALEDDRYAPHVAEYFMRHGRYNPRTESWHL